MFWFNKQKRIEESAKVIQASTDSLIKGISGVLIQFSTAIEKDINLHTDLRFNELTKTFKTLFEPDKEMLKQIQEEFKSEFRRDIKPVTVKSPDEYVAYLQYARDKFAVTAHEKGVITGIINKIKKIK